MLYRETTVLCYRDRKTMILAQSGQDPPTVYRETAVLSYRDRKTMLLAQSAQEPPTYAIQRDYSIMLLR
jgi:hypothetical protein